MKGLIEGGVKKSLKMVYSPSIMKFFVRCQKLKGCLMNII